MVAAKSTDAELIRLIEERGITGAARATNTGERNVSERRRRLEKKYQIRINVPEYRTAKPIKEHPAEVHIEVKNGIVIAAGDGHYWPGEATTAHRALVKFIKDMRPKVVVLNGDCFDGARISRHPPTNWNKQPTVQQEIEVVQDRLHEIAMACPKGCRRTWPIGNHDWRFECRLATVAPEYADVTGVSLQDHFPLWEPCWSTVINGNAPHKGDSIVCLHNYKGGKHATLNNTLWAGRTIVTNHLHSPKVAPLTDYNGTRYGVDTGMIADPDSGAFDYTQRRPLDWRSGFAVLTIKDGKLLMPELVTVWEEGSVQFRGEIVKV